MERIRTENKNTVWEAALPLRGIAQTTGEIDSARKSIGPNGTVSHSLKVSNAETRGAGQTPLRGNTRRTAADNISISDHAAIVKIFFGTKNRILMSE